MRRLRTGRKAPLGVPQLKGAFVELQVPITIFDELSEEVIESSGQLDLASGEIRRLEYKDHDVGLKGLPADQEDYEFTCGVLSNNGKDVEFRVEVNVLTGKYSVSPSELLEIKVRAAKLFAGLEGRALLDGADQGKKPTAKSADKSTPPKGRNSPFH
jgi:hypothetical protein